MALEKTEYPLVVDCGINTKIDPKLLPIGQNIEVINAQFEKIGQLKKMDGITQLSDDLNPSGSLSSRSISKIISFRDQLLALGKAGTNDWFGYSESAQAWETKFSTDEPANAIPAQIKSKKISSALGGSLYYDSDEAPSYGARAICYQSVRETDGAPVIILSIQDYETGDIRFISEVESDVLGLCMVRIYDDPNPVIWLVWVNASLELTCRTYNLNGSVSDTPIALVTSDYYPFHIAKISSGLAIASYTSVSTEIALAVVGTDGIISTSDTVTVAPLYIVGFIRILPVGTDLFIFYKVVSGGDIRVFSVTQADVTVGVLAQQDFADSGVLGISFDNFAVIANAAEDKIYGLMEEFTPAASSLYDTNLSQISFVEMSTAGAVSYRETEFFLARIAAGPFRYDQSDDSFFAIFETNNYPQSTYFLVKFDPNIDPPSVDYRLCARFSVWKARGQTGVVVDDYRTINNVAMGDDGKFYFINGYSGRTITTAGDIVPIKSLQLTEIDLNAEHEHFSSILGDLLVLSGGLPLEYDGYNIFEQNYNQYPICANSLDDTVGTIPNGTYLYKAIWEFTDINGNVHRSTPSPVLSHTKSSGPSNIIVRVLSNLKLMDSDKYRFKQFGLILYRTTVNSSGPYYRVASHSVPASWFGTGMVNEITDTYSDSTISGNELLYTDGGVLSYDPLPSIKYIISANNRMFALSSEDPNELWYSQKWLPGEPVNFSAFLNLRLDQGLLRDSGDGVALGVLGNAIIILKDNCITGFEGDGPLATGEQNNFTEPKLLSSDIGCSNPRSVVSTPSGIFFKSGKGIYSINAGYEIKYIGAPIEAYNDEEILDATVIEGKNLVVFVTSSMALLYNYQQNKWSTSSFLAGKSVCNWKNRLALLKADNTIYVQEDGVYKDGQDYYGMKLVTPWLKVSGIQNFGRLWEIVILGDYHDAHTLRVKIYFDYDQTDFITYTLAPEAGDGVYQYRIHMERQKMEAVKIEIEDLPEEDSTGESFSLSNITLLLGRKRGTYKNINDGRKY